MKTSPPGSAGSPSELIDARIEALGDWRGTLLAPYKKVVKVTFAKGASLADPGRGKTGATVAKERSE